jgi:uncharacterized protein YcbK (DUF882 family)
VPSVNVPLKGMPGWQDLQTKRRLFWGKEDRSELTAHFRAEEFHCHDGSITPTSARPALVRLCQTFLEPMRTKFGACHVLSGYRNELYNAKIGGARHSQHIYEQSFESVAADLRFQKGTPVQWAAEAKRLRSKAGGNGGVGTYPRSGFVHVDNRGYKADWSG